MSKSLKIKENTYKETKYALLGIFHLLLFFFGIFIAMANAVESIGNQNSFGKFVSFILLLYSFAILYSSLKIFNKHKIVKE